MNVQDKPFFAYFQLGSPHASVFKLMIPPSATSQRNFAGLRMMSPISLSLTRCRLPGALRRGLGNYNNSWPGPGKRSPMGADMGR